MKKLILFLFLILLAGQVIGKSYTFYDSLRPHYSRKYFKALVAKFKGDIKGIERSLLKSRSLRYPPSYWRLALFYAKIGKKKKLRLATAGYRRALRKQSRRIWYRQNLWYSVARSYYLEGNYKKSIRLHKFSYRKNYRWSINLYWLSECWLKLGKTSTALRYLKQYLRKSRFRYGPGYVWVLGSFYERSGKKQMAVSLYRRYLRYRKRGYKVYEMLLDVKKSKKTLVALATRYMKYNYPNMQNLHRALGWFYARKAYKAALRFVKKQQKRFKRRSVRAFYLLQRASLYEKVGNYLKAVADYKQAIVLRSKAGAGPIELTFYRKKVVSALAAGGTATGVAKYLAKYFSGPKYRQLRFFCGFELFLRAKSWTQAMRTAVEFLSGKKGDWQRINLFYTQAITSLMERYGKLESAWYFWQKLIAKRADPVVTAEYGLYLVKLRKHTLAQNYLVDAYKRAPTILKLLPELAWVMAKNGMYDKAHQYLCRSAYLLGTTTSKQLGNRYPGLVVKLKRALGKVAYLVLHNASDKATASR